MSYFNKTMRVVAVCCALTILFSAKLQAQCTPAPFSINQAPVVTGTAGAVNTKYKRTNVLPGVDAEFTIVSLNNGATLASEDDAVGAAGYQDAWQPQVVAGAANGDGGITWRVNFFVNGTATPYRFNCLSILAVDVDGNGDLLREYVEAGQPYSYTLQSNSTYLSYTSASANTGIRATATTNNQIANIDSTAKQAMILYRFVNVTGVTYTTGYSKTGNTGTRQFCAFFSRSTNFPSQGTRFFNTDNDGVNGINSATDIDDDNDGVPDANEYPATYADPLGDADADGLMNYQDATPGTGVPAFVDSNGDGVNDNYDIDLDGVINSLDLDSDNDGIPDLVEAGGIDINGDGLVDGTFADSDGDGLSDTYDASTGGANIANLDTDGDGIPNARDLDSDGDGIPDVREAGGTDANNDGRIDGFNDVDSDGLTDTVDGDVNNDGVAENTANALIITSTVGGTPGRPASYPRANADGNGLPNPYDLDSDGDGITDSRESGLTQDTNNDGVINGTDTGFTDTNGDGWSDQVDAIATLTPTNTDGDARPNYLDIDSDNDGITDIVEGQTTAGYLAPLGTDTDGDGIDNRYDNVTGTYGGNANNGITPTNTDGTDNPDYLDLDSDNDGRSDRIEGFDTNGNGIIDGTEKAYVGTTDTDGDGLLDEYDTVSGTTTANNNTNNTTPASFPDVVNAGGDRDWRQVVSCAGNRLVNPSFELPLQTGNGNHILATTVVVPGWRTSTGAQFNLVIPGGNYTGGPNAAHDGTQYLDIANAAGIFTQVFDLTCASSVNFGGFFSSRELANYTPWTAKIEITTINGTVVATSDTRNFTTADADGNPGDAVWYQLNGTSGNLPAGRYIFKVTMGDSGNFDDAYLCVTGCYKYPDADGDGIGNTTDLDSDNDGITDLIENGGFDAYGDADNDGIPNFSDTTPGAGLPAFTDTNNDGINDAYDTDKDGIINSEDLDTDGDGITDIVEAGGIDIDGTGTVDGTFADSDGDGLANIYDASTGGVNIANLDTDADGIPNFRDLDSDGDGIPDVVEAGGIDANNDGRLDNTTDSDRDGLSDLVDGDVGNDGTAENTAGALIITSGVGGTAGRPASYPRANADGNGLPNPYDLDSDGDGILDSREAGIAQDTNNDGVVNGTDTGYTDTNGDGWSDQVDAIVTLTPTNTDGDARPNYLDIDSDNDGIVDNIEGQTTAGYLAPLGTDTDGDGIDNRYDNVTGTYGGNANNGVTPTNTDGTDNADYLDADSDNDGKPDRLEGFDTNGNGTIDGAEKAYVGTTDTDGDGLLDEYDTVNGVATANNSTNNTTPASFPDVNNPGGNRDWRQAQDTDNDGVPDITDLDDDNDGIADTVENGGFNPYGDTDADGIPNYLDATPGAGQPTFTDVNGDGINDFYDTDRDGVLNSQDLDGDNDGIPDLVEAGGIDSNGDGVVDGFADSDGDGLTNVYDVSTGGVNIANLDTDGDGIPNARDLDSDGDGIPDVREAGGTDADNDGRIDNFTDTDRDGLADSIDGDVGNDGTPESTANALIITSAAGTNGRPNSYPRSNADGNGLPNPYDLDSDGDGILDSREAGIAQDTNNDGVVNGSDTGFTDTNNDGWSDQVDAIATLTPTNTDGDARPNYLDIDSDNDGIVDNIEGQTTAGYLAPLGTDTDGDGIDNRYDNVTGTYGGNANNGVTPTNTDGTDTPDYLDLDSDNDGKSDRLEGFDTNGNGVIDGGEKAYVGTTDTDGDGLLDEYDVVNGVATANNVTNNATPASFPDLQPAGGDRDWRQAVDTDKDGVPDATDLDDDNDGIPDLIENGGFNPYADTDNDGIPNYLDTTPGAGQPTFTDVNSDGINDFYDTDRDGVLNSQDLDGDGDGIPDLVEAGGIDTDGNGMVDNFADSDGDGLANTYDNTTGGVNIPNLDTDGDGIPNAKDLDSDGDGIPDVREAGGTDANNDGKLDNTTDTDGDGLADIVDGDVGNDGVSENTANALIITSTVGGTAGRPASYPRANADGNGLPNPYDLDADGDGILDSREAGITQDTNNDGVINGADTGFTDTNSDGWSDQVDVIATLTPTNTDGDARPNYLDIDSDNDGITDIVEGQTTVGYLAPLGTDTDGDGIDNRYDNVTGTYGGNANNGITPTNTDGTDSPDYLDADSDNDGKSDRLEGFDTNGNGVIDGAEKAYVGTTDTDGDGLLDEYDTVNGIATANNTTNNTTPNSFPDVNAPGGDRDWRQVMDTDNDGIADEFDLDDDNDGIPDTIENGICSPSSPLCDLDGDGIPNSRDLDSDNDGILDLYESGNAAAIAADINSDGTISNSESPAGADGIPLAAQGTEGTAPPTIRNTDGDGRPDAYDLDSDNDGINDLTEAGNTGIIDVNSDGVVDGPDSDGDGIMDSADANDALFGDPDLTDTPRDTDGDGIPDYRDLDSDNDGINDLTELGNVGIIDVNSDGVVDGPDSDGDGIMDSADANDALFGDPDMTDAPRDTDGDGIPDYRDLDSDNDGINDLTELGNVGIIDTNSDGVVDGPDSDGDGIMDSADANDTTYGDPDLTDAPRDTDGDGVPDYRDLDSDNDGISDLDEAGNVGIIDANSDGVVDGPDSDGDGIMDSADANDSVYGDPDLTDAPRDTDGDGIPDYRDLDSDNDGINDITEAGNNADLDGNGMVDGPDTDGDGIRDAADGNPNVFGDPDMNDTPNPAVITVNGTVLTGPDTDGDGILDAADGNPNAFGDKVPDLTPTTDIDDLSFAANASRDFAVNIFEILNATPTGTVSFRVNRISGWDITVPGITLGTTDVSGISNTSNVNGGTPNENGKFLFKQNAGFITITLKTGFTIPPNGQVIIGFNATRRAGTINGTAQNITATIVSNSGSETNVNNNRVITTISAN